MSGQQLKSVDDLLDELHRRARGQQPYYGLPIWGPDSIRGDLRELIERWVYENKQESHR